MSIFPLPVFEADADPHHRDARTDEEIYQQLKPPSTIVARFGMMRWVGEFPYDGDVKPGCGSKLTARTRRGTEIVEMLTTTCENAGCAKSVTRQELLEYIDNSGGRDFPFQTDGKILHVATIEELNKQAALESNKKGYIKKCKELIRELNLAMKLVEVEPILGEELLTFYFMSQERIDFRRLVRDLAAEFKTRIEMRQVGARDEARLVADYERCGQHCCCRQFLKVLKPVSMKSAKLQKATLDPLKISGRCGRLMCCLRYEDQTYEQLRKKLPRRNTRVGTSEGPGIVLDTKILVQLALVRLEHNGEEIAVPIEELTDPEQCRVPPKDEPADGEPDPLRGLSAGEAARRSDDRGGGRSGRKKRSRADQQDAYRAKSIEKEAAGDRGGTDSPPPEEPRPQPGAEGSEDKPKQKKRRRRRRRGREHGGGGGSGGSSGGSGGGSAG